VTRRVKFLTTLGTGLAITATIWLFGADDDAMSREQASPPSDAVEAARSEDAPAVAEAVDASRVAAAPFADKDGNADSRSASRPSATLVVRVVTETAGGPVAGAQVSVRGCGAPSFATTGDDGTATIRRATLGDVRIAVVAAGFAPITAEAALTSFDVERTTVALVPDARLRVRVLSDAGVPVPGASVELHVPDGPAWTDVSEVAGMQRARGVTDDAGEALLAGLAPDAVYVRVAAEGYGTAVKVTRVRAGTETPLEVRLEPGSELRLVFKDRTTEEPLPHRRITVYFGAVRPQSFYGTPRTDEEGVVRLVRPTDVAVLLSSAPNESCAFPPTEVPPGVGEFTILARPPSDLACRVVSASGGLVDVAALEQRYDDGRIDVVVSTADAAGLHYVPQQFGMGAPSFRFTADVGASAWKHYDYVRDTTRTLEVVLVPRVPVRLRLVDENGAPVAGAVFVEGLRRLASKDVAVGRPRSSESTIPAGADGVARFALPRNGAYEIAVRSRERGAYYALLWTAARERAPINRGPFGVQDPFWSAVRDDDPEIDLGDVRLPRPGSVTVACAPVAAGERFRVALRPQDRGAWTAVGVSALIDAHGVARLPVVPPGTYRPDLGGSPLRTTGDALAQLVPQEPFVVASGGDVTRAVAR
jgi:hypothetical protein